MATPDTNPQPFSFAKMSGANRDIGFAVGMVGDFGLDPDGCALDRHTAGIQLFPDAVAGCYHAATGAECFVHPAYS